MPDPKVWTKDNAQSNNRTASTGNPLDFEDDAEFFQSLADSGARLADCGQYAARRTLYSVGTIDPFSGAFGPLAYTSPPYFNPFHLLIGDLLKTAVVPAFTEGIAFNITSQTHKWHYGRLHNDGSVSMTDANRHTEELENPGGAFIAFDSQMTTRATVGVQPVTRLNNIGEFVDYCEKTYENYKAKEDGVFFFVYFGN